MMPLRVDIKAPGDPRVLVALLEGLTRANQVVMDVLQRNGRPLPQLYDAGASYKREKGTERWQFAHEVVKAGEGDCEDLAGYRAAELRRAGEGDAYVDVVPAKSKRGYHAIVRRQDGSTEDPSMVLLGMRPEGTKMERNTVIDVRDDGSCYVGEVEVPAGEGDIAVRAKGDTGAQALERAANVAQSIMDDPSVAPFVPPEARAAVAGAKLLAKAASSGFLSSIFGRLSGQNKRRLARVLLESTPHGDHRVGTLSIGGPIVVTGGRRRGAGTVIRVPGAQAAGKPGFVWNPDPPPGHWERERPPQYPSDPYAQPPYYGGYDPYGQGAPPYGGYPPMDPYYGYGPYAPVDPWAQYAQYGWAPAASPWGQGWDTIMAEQFGSQMLDALWPQLRQQQGG